MKPVLAFSLRLGANLNMNIIDYRENSLFLIEWEREINERFIKTDIRSFSNWDR